MQRSPIQRLVEVLTVMTITVFAVSGFFGLRTLAWRHDTQVGVQVLTGVVASAIAVGIPGLFYILFGASFLRLLRIDWISVQFGGVVGMAIYGIANAIAPLVPEAARFDVGRRLLVGALDGMVIGVAAGAVVAFVSGRPMRFSRTGITRYLIVFIAVICIVWLVILISTALGTSDLVALGMLIPPVLVMKVIISRRFAQETADAGGYGYDEGAYYPPEDEGYYQE